jgi:hypothetical protein
LSSGSSQHHDGGLSASPLATPTSSARTPWWRPVGSRAGAVATGLGVAVDQRLSPLCRCLNPSMAPFPAPARSHVAQLRAKTFPRLLYARAASPISLRFSSAMYTCAPSDFYDSLGHASTDRVTWKPVCPRWELQPDSRLERRSACSGTPIRKVRLRESFARICATTFCTPRESQPATTG